MPGPSTLGYIRARFGCITYRELAETDAGTRARLSGDAHAHRIASRPPEHIDSFAGRRCDAAGVPHLACGGAGPKIIRTLGSTLYRLAPRHVRSRAQASVARPCDGSDHRPRN